VGSAGVAKVPYAVGRQTAPEPSLPAGNLAVDSLTDICDWLGTFRERLRMARDEDQDKLGVLIAGMTARYHLRRAEPA
jgi:hypothetical protein